MKVNEQLNKYILSLFDLLAFGSILYALINYSPKKLPLQFFFIVVMVLVKISPKKIYNAVYIGLDLPILFCMLYIFYDNILSIPIIVFLISDTLKAIYRGGYRKIHKSMESFQGTLKLIIPLLASAIIFKIFDLKNVTNLNIIILAGFTTYALVNIYTLHLTLAVYKRMKLFQILDTRWILLYFTLQCFFTIVIIQGYDYFGLAGFFMVYAVNVMIMNTLNQSISIEKHQVIYKETLEYFADFYKYGILILDQDLNILSVNEQFLIANKLNSDKIVGQNYQKLHNNFQFTEYVQNTLDKIKGKHKIFESTFSFEAQQFSLLGISTGNKEKSKLIFLLKDITTKQLKDIEYITKCKLESIQELAAGTANDIKNPLTVANGFLQLLKLQLKGPTEQYYVDQALKAISDTDEYIEIFALWGNQSKDHHKFKEINLTELVEEIIDNFKEKQRQKDVKLDYNLKKEILIYGKEKLIQKAISSVMDNALDAVGGNGHITTVLKKEGNNVIIEIKDDGIGIEHENLSKVFDPYFTTKGNNSKGLGLFYSKKILTQHNGEISLQSSPNKGTKATIVISTVNN